jgi:hypothetical protein
MGTTRMHDSPRLGVMDRNCRVQGTSNLYIAGSSVFPMVGGNFTSIPLSHWHYLADHITAEVRRASYAPRSLVDETGDEAKRYAET